MNFEYIFNTNFLVFHVLLTARRIDRLMYVYNLQAESKLYSIEHI